MKKSLVAALAAAPVLFGCVHSTPMMTPNGDRGYAINCSATNDIGDCYVRAGLMCGPSGYEVLNQQNKAQGFFTPADKTLVVRCKSFQEVASNTSPATKP